MAIQIFKKKYGLIGILKNKWRILKCKKTIYYKLTIIFVNTIFSMHLINYTKLAEDLRDGKVSERQKLYYLIGLTLFAIPLLMPSMPENPNDISKDIMWALGFVVMSIVIMVLLYRRNQQGDGKHFLERYICLAFPISIIWWCIGLLSSTTILLFFVVLKWENFTETIIPDYIIDRIDTVGGLFAILVTFILYWQAIKIASTQKK